MKPADMLNMKLTTAAIVLSLAISAWAQEYWIQVLNCEGDMPKSFEQKLKQNELSYKRDGNKVLVGAYESYQSAQNAMHMVRCRVASDAFIVPHEAVEKESVLKPMSEETVMADQNVTQEAETVAQAIEPCVCICDKHALRKSQIEQALDFYKNSSYHRFEERMLPGF